MSVSYQAVGWNRQKKLVDRWLLLGVALFIGAFVGVGAGVNPEATAETHVIRASGAAAIVLLHVILCIGPLARLDRRFLPLLYNRRHLGVTMFLLALVHGAFSLVQFHALGDTDPLVSLFTANSRYDSLAWFPFQPLGFAALAILFLMAATSHDFWLANLTPPVWKALHMLVYLAWALAVMHVALGALQAETHPAFAALVGAGVVVVLALHLAAGNAERELDRPTDEHGAEDGFVDACAVADVPPERARVVNLGGERVAIFRHGETLSAVSNVCQHQNGPLGEGRIIDGCITCPWHGYQYDPATGCSPPPFEEKIATFPLRIDNGRVFVRAWPEARGTRIEPALVPGRAN